jgi:hypothetical protein
VVTAGPEHGRGKLLKPLWSLLRLSPKRQRDQCVGREQIESSRPVAGL